MRLRHSTDTHQPEHRSSIGGAAPQPRRDRQVLLKRDSQPVRPGQRRKRLGNDIAKRISQLTGKFANHPQLVARRRAGRQPIARIDKREQRLELVIPVLPPPPDVQRKVDLGPGGFGELHDLGLAARVQLNSWRAGIQFRLSTRLKVSGE